MGVYAIDGTNINNFIFHVIHHGKDEPLYLDGADISNFTDFFHERLKDTATGATYSFNKDSRCKELIDKYLEDTVLFIEFSKKIAKHFNDHGRGNVKPGALVIMSLGDDKKQFISLIKFDHEEIVSYKIEDKMALLEEIQNNFTKSKKAMQKSVLIEVTGGKCGNLLVIDRNSPIIADFFRKFLDAKKTRSDKEHTQVLCDIAEEIKKTFKSELKPDFKKNFTKNLYTIISTMEYFEKDDFFNQLFGEYSNNIKIRNKYDKQLEKLQLSGEKFKPDSSVPKKPKYTLKTTAEGITIKIPYNAEDTISEKKLDNNRTEITITTTEITKDEAHYN